MQQDGDELDHLRGARHGHRHHRSRDGEIASSGAGIPAFIGVLDKAVKVIVQKFDKPGDIEPGDVFATNDPYYGGVTHLNDIIVAMPVFADGEHHRLDRQHRPRNSDVGGMAPGSLTGEATEIFQEGLRAPGDQADLARASRSAGDRHHQRSIRACPTCCEATSGRRSPRCASAPGGSSSSPRNTASRPSRPPWRHFMDFGEQVSLAELAQAAEGHVRAVGGAG